MKRMAVWVFIGVLITGISCDLSSNETRFREVISFTDVPNYEHFELPDPGTFIVTSDSVWQKLITDYYRYRDSLNNPIDPPSVNFAQKMVIVVAYGGNCRYSGCTNKANTITKVGRVYENARLTRYEVEIAPIGNLGECTLCLHPLHMVTVDKFDGEVRFLGAVPK